MTKILNIGSMKLLCRLAIVLGIALLSASCGGGNEVVSGGGTGFGGTGVSYVKGNVAQVNGQKISHFDTEQNWNSSVALANFILQISHAQSIDFSQIIVKGGGKTANLNQTGEFELQGVNPTENFMLVFDIVGTGTASLNIGAVPKGISVNIKDIIIDTSNGNAQSNQITSELVIPIAASQEIEDSSSSEDEGYSTSEDHSSSDSHEEVQGNGGEGEEDDVSEDENLEDEEDDDSEEGSEK